VLPGRRTEEKEPAGGKRKHSVAMVTHRPGEKVANVVSFVEGYPLKEGSNVSLDIGGAKFDLFTKGDSAWARTAELDKAIVEAMAKAKQATVKSMPQKGPSTTDTYSLAGFAQALALIDKACDVKR
jgi:Invasion associated locus B (IalB) protein